MHSWLLLGLKVSFSFLLEIFNNFKKTCVVKKCQRDFDEKILNLKKNNSRTILMQTFADILFL